VTPYAAPVKAARRKARLTQAQLATKAGVSASTISVLERGKPSSLPTLDKVVAALGITLAVRGKRGGGA